jgi:hypothetical protein
MLTIVFTCVYALAYTQVNYVKNPSFEEYSKCPDDWNKIYYANNWRNATDSVMVIGMEYYNECGNVYLDKNAHIPDNGGFYQFAHFGKGLAGAHFYNDKSVWVDKGDLPYNYRDNLQGHLFKSLLAGKIYCVSFWVNLAEATGYAQNKLGAYLDNGAINLIADTAGEEITSVTPQVYTNTIIEDTMNWVKIEGSFVATGNETYITIGNFFKNSAVATKYPNYWTAFYTTSYYLIDDVSVIPIDLDVKAGADTYVEQGSKRKIGRVEDSATILGLDCKWYKKGVLIDSGAIISVNANAIKGVVDTYVVVQTICGVVKSDTVLVKTVGLGVHEFGFENTFAIYPNPSNGTLNISASFEPNNIITSKVYDLLGRELFRQKLSFSNKQATLKMEIPNGTYLLELQDESGNVQRERIVVQ